MPHPCRWMFLCLSLAVLPLLLVGCDDTTAPTTVCDTQTEIPEAECEALAAFFESTDGPAWERSDGWMETDTPCTWHGLECEGGSVVEIELGGNGLSGTLPSELADLTNLEDLGIPSNDLSGPIPPELGSLQKLEFLYLFSNELSGSIPPELGNLSSLRLLFLRNNRLTGSIPPKLGSLPVLLRLVLSNNQLTGTIPPEIGNLQGMDNLWLFGNDLEGAVPLAVAQLGAAIQEADGSCDLAPGNDDLYIPDDDAYRAADLDGDGFICDLPVPAGGGGDG